MHTIKHHIVHGHLGVVFHVAQPKLQSSFCNFAPYHRELEVVVEDRMVVPYPYGVG